MPSREKLEPGDGNCGKPVWKKLLDLSEKHTMDSDLVGDLLYRTITP